MRQVVLIFCMILLAACARQDVFKDQFDNEKPWVEQQAQLPPYPTQENLIAVDAGSTTSYQYFVDTTSIDIGQDGVIRFSLIAQSSSGAMNVSYEGIRCETKERKLYALGRDDKTWVKPRISEWQELQFVRQFFAQRELYKNIFCPQELIVGSSKEAIRALKSGMHHRMRR